MQSRYSINYSNTRFPRNLAISTALQEEKKRNDSVKLLYSVQSIGTRYRVSGVNGGAWHDAAGAKSGVQRFDSPANID